MIKQDQPEFPNTHVNSSKDDRDFTSSGWCGGMTLREYYAIRVMQALIGRGMLGDIYRHGPEYLVKSSVIITDELIRELNK